MAESNGYSATVGLTLVVDGTELALSHVGPGGLVVRDECQPLPAQEATLRIAIDDSVESVNVFLPDGVVGPDVNTAYSSICEGVSPRKKDHQSSGRFRS